MEIKKQLSKIQSVSDSGFTLVELLVTITIIGSAIVPMAQAFVHSMRATQEAKRVSIATMLARQKLEKIKGTNSFDALPSGDNGSFLSPYSRYKWETAIQDVSSPDSDFLVKKILIRVEFPSNYGDARTVNCQPASGCSDWDFATYVAKKGID